MSGWIASLTAAFSLLAFSAVAQVETQADVQAGTSRTNVVTAKPKANDIVSKTYELKHADPYELKPVLESAVRAGSPRGRVEGVKYMDGKGAVVVSAEAYRFEKTPGGQSIDDLIAALDKPGARAAPDAGEFKLLTPRYVDADTAARMLRRSGLQRNGDPYELQFGGGTARVDRGLNAVLVHTSPSNMKQVEAAMKAYDNPALELFLRIRVYELEELSDTALSAGYESWRGGRKELQAKCVGIPQVSAEYLESLAARGKAALVLERSGPFLAGEPWGFKLDSTDSSVDDTGVWRTGLDAGLKVLAAPSPEGVAFTARCSWLAGFDKSRKEILGSSSASSLVPWGSACVAGLENAIRLKSFSGEHQFWSKLGGSVEDGVRRTRLALLVEAMTRAPNAAEGASSP